MIDEDYREEFAGIDTGEQEEPSPRRWRSALGDVVETILLATVVFIIINVLSTRIRVESVSMIPTLMPGDFVLIDKVSYRFRPVSRGEIIVFDLPADTSQRYIKRVIGLPGETVNIRGDQVYIDGELLSEPYINVPTNRGGTWDVPDGAYFVMGDNRGNSSDSRSWGFVDRSLVNGRALVIYWPPPEWAFLGQMVSSAPGGG